MIVAVTGAGGLIGAPLVAALARDEGVEEVLAIDVRPPSTRPLAGVRALQRDTRDPRLFADLAGADALVHLAFRVLDARGSETANVAGSRNAFSAAIAAGATTIVHASSGVVYGSSPENPVPLDEQHALRAVPPFAYPTAKVQVERGLDELGARHPAVRVVRLRPTTTLGAGAPALLLGRLYVRLSDYDPPLQFTWVDDVVSAFVAALKSPAASGAYNVGASGTVLTSEVAGVLGVPSVGLPHRVRRGAAAAANRLGVPGALDPGFVDIARHPIVVDSSRARRELGWREQRDSAAALTRFRETL